MPTDEQSNQPTSVGIASPLTDTAVTDLSYDVALEIANAVKARVSKRQVKTLMKQRGVGYRQRGKIVLRIRSFFSVKRTADDWLDADTASAPTDLLARWIMTEKGSAVWGKRSRSELNESEIQAYISINKSRRWGQIFSTYMVAHWLGWLAIMMPIKPSPTMAVLLFVIGATLPSIYRGNQVAHAGKFLGLSRQEDALLRKELSKIAGRTIFPIRRNTAKEIADRYRLLNPHLEKDVLPTN